MSVLRPTSLGSRTVRSWFRVGPELPTSNAEAVVGRTNLIKRSRRLRSPTRVSQSPPPCVQTAGYLPPAKTADKCRKNQYWRSDPCSSAKTVTLYPQRTETLRPAPQVQPPIGSTHLLCTIAQLSFRRAPCEPRDPYPTPSGPRRENTDDIICCGAPLRT